MSNEWKKLGSLRKGKTGNLYIKLDGDVALNKDAVIQLQDPRKRIQSSVEAGRLTEEKGSEMLEKIPDYIRYELILPPNKN